MARFVRLESHADNTPPVYVNPEHVVSVTHCSEGGTSIWTTLDVGYHVLPDIEDVVDMLHLVYRVDLTDQDKALVKENLNRPEVAPSRCTGDPCTCTNGIGCVNVPLEQW